MIKVTRDPTPPILRKHADQWLSELQGASTRTAKERARNRYRHEEVKQTLLRMFHGKCAYCESKITHIEYGHIEHYRPKSGRVGREDLTFEWSNLLLACGICNGPQFKGEHFPEAADVGPILNPCEDEPNDHLEFRYDPIAKLACVYGRTPRGKVTETLLGLNRRELRKHRSDFVKKLIALAQFAMTDPDAATLIEQATHSEAEYSAFARTIRT